MQRKISTFLIYAGRLLGRYYKINLPDKQPNMSKFKTVKEGKASVLYPDSVFYNPVQEFNRDLTIAVISQVAYERFYKSHTKRSAPKSSQNVGNKNVKVGDGMEETGANMESSCDFTAAPAGSDQEEELVPGQQYENGIRILEGLAASGLRSMRFGLEIPGVKEIVANDFDFTAVEAIQKNIELNNLQELVRSNCADAAMVMYQNRLNTTESKRFDVIDLDPYGSPHMFLDAAVQAVNDGGLLCVTCTDAGVLCGNSPETCYSKYGSTSLRTKYCHEMAIRIILQSIESHANRYSRYTEPLISLSVDFYFRVFVRVYTGQNKVKQSMSKMALIYHCTGCGAFHQQRVGQTVPTKGNNFKYAPASGPPVLARCEHCNSKHLLGGPVWAEPMYNTSFVQSVLARVEKNKDRFKTADRIIGMLNVVNEELQDVPMYYIMDELCNIIHCTPFSFIQFRSAVLNAGYRVSLAHPKRNSIKTDAPVQVIWDILRTWVKDNPVSAKHLVDGSPAKAILSKEPITKISFETHPDANPPSRVKKLTRYQPNPEKFWGPKPRAKRALPPDTNT